MNKSVITITENSFDFDRFCYLDGDGVEISSAYRIILLVIFSVIGLLVLIANGVVLLTIAKNRKEYLKKENTFVLVLFIHDLLFGCTVIPLFLIELTRLRETSLDCVVKSVRVLLFVYFLSCRILGIFFISFQTYVRTNLQKTMLELRLHKYSYLINIFFVWMPGIVFIMAIGLSPLDVRHMRASVAFIPLIVILVLTVVFYIMVLRVIKRSTHRSTQCSQQSSPIYHEAAAYVKKILVWLLITNIPLCACGFALLVYSFFPDSREDVIQQIYVLASAVNAIDAIINPYLLVSNHSNLDGQLKEYWRRLRTSKSVEEESKEMDDLGHQVHSFSNLGYEGN